MRGDGSPTSISSTRLPPMSVSRKTIAAGSAWTVPMMTASRPDGCERTAASAASATSGATIVNSESMLTLQRLIYDVEMIARPSLEIGDLSQRKHLACPAPVHRNPLIGLGCADESIPITFPDDVAMLWQP